MCGRFALSIPMNELMDYFEVEDGVEFATRYNIAPTQDVLVVRNNTENKREFALVRWGLIPSWQNEEDISSDWINARAETAAEKPLFKNAFKQRRCLIVADGFYEWQKGKTKTPFYIYKKDGKPLAMAGLWEQWESKSGEAIESCTILTSNANRLVKPIHHRMPAILQRPEFATWLNVENQNVEKLQHLLRPYEAENLASYAVSTFVNSPTHEGKECVQQVG